MLKGAKALALPTARGQILNVDKGQNLIRWESLDQEGQCWFEASFDLALKTVNTTDNQRADFISSLLQRAHHIAGLSPEPAGYRTTMEFPANWGLGSSSSLTYLLASHFHIDPFELFFATQNGSGYDIACAGTTAPLLYELQSGKPHWREVKISGLFRQARFVYLGHKQDSRKEVNRFRKRAITEEQIARISAISEALADVQEESALIELLERHEALMSQILGRQTVKQLLFSDFPGAIKSLGAWGGDFVMAIGPDAENYFHGKGYREVLSFDDLFASAAR